MIFTARQLEELHRSNGHVTLPYRARLSPLAQDWVRQKKIAIGYADVETKPPNSSTPRDEPLASSRPFVWWCDGPCGPAKAALMAQSKESSLNELGVANDANQLVGAIRRIADEIKSEKISGAILLVKTGAEAIVYANRCPSLRAILGTCIDAVEQGIQQVAANVLVIEHPYKTLSQVKNLVGRFVRGKRELSDAVRARLKELSTCG
jgi:ribose 5-phosphate isomerase RpiB